MNDSDVGYDLEWNGWNKRPDLTNHIGWVRVFSNGQVQQYQTWEELMNSDSYNGNVMTSEFYETKYKQLNQKCG
jgi:hypothetical protein